MAVGDVTVGRRIPVPASGDVNEVILDLEPGDYCGPITGYTADKPAVFFMLPTARDEGVHPAERSIRHVVSPPHTFHEQPDGSLEIRASILLPDSGWHGFLDAGHRWRQV